MHLPHVQTFSPNDRCSTHRPQLLYPGLTNVSRASMLDWHVYRDRYVALLRAQQPHSQWWQLVKAVLDRFTRYAGIEWQPCPVNLISQDMYEQWFIRRRSDTWRGDPLSPRTVNNEIKILNQAFARLGPKTRGEGKDNYGLHSDPPWLRCLPEMYVEPVVLEDSQIVAALEAMIEHARCPQIPGLEPADFWRAAIVLDLATLLRRRALLQIPRPADSVLLDDLQLILPAHLNKTRREIRLALGSRTVAEIIASMPTRVGEPILPWRRKRKGKWMPMTPAYFSNEFARMQKAAGIDRPIRLKEIRSTGGTRIADQFGDAVAKKALGHSPASNTIQRHYKNYRPTEANQRASAEMTSCVLASISAAKPA